MLWTARIHDDWPVAFDFFEPQRRAVMELDKYIEWQKENEQFKYNSFKIGRVDVQAPVGWVELDTSTLMRKYPKVPARDVHRWEKWRIADGQWYPIPLRELEFYPAAPSERDAAEEARLKARFEVSWRARFDQDWHTLHEMVVPGRREQVTEEQIAESELLLKRVTYDLKWVEVIGDRGRVHAVYQIKLMDNLKEPPRETPVTEPWIKWQGEWYLDFTDQTSERSSP